MRWRRGWCRADPILASTRVDAAARCRHSRGVRLRGHFAAQFLRDAAKTLGEKFRAAAEPDAQEAFETEMHARHDQHALIHADALAEWVTQDGGMVAHQAQCAGLRLSKFQEA